MQPNRVRIPAGRMDERRVGGGVRPEEAEDDRGRALGGQPDPARLRPSDVPRSVADIRKFTRATGWQPRISIEQSLRDILDYWRQTVSQPSGVQLAGHTH